MKGCKGSELVVNLRSKTASRFKAGADLSSSVNAVDIGWDESQDGDDIVLDFHIHLKAEGCAAK